MQEAETLVKAITKLYPILVLIGGGIALLVIKEVFAFVKWWRKSHKEDEAEVKKETGKDNPGTEGVVVKSALALLEANRDNLSRMADQMENIGNSMSLIQVDLGICKTKIDFIAKKQDEQNGDLGEMAKKMESMAKNYADRILVCEKRFSGLHEKIVTDV